VSGTRITPSVSGPDAHGPTTSALVLGTTVPGTRTAASVLGTTPPEPETCALVPRTTTMGLGPGAAGLTSGASDPRPIALVLVIGASVPAAGSFFFA
jgi:hypothetical protein